MTMAWLSMGRSRRSAPEVETPRQARERGEAKLGPYLTENDIPGNGHRRERMTNRVLVVVCGVTMLIAMVEGLAIVELLPLYKVVPVFVQFSDKSDQVVRIEPPTGRIPSIAILTEANVRDYVKQRNEISPDANETIDRWGGKIRIMSSESVYNTFMAETKPVYEEIRAGNFTRQIEIKSVLRTTPGYYQVEFVAYDHKQGTGLSDANDTKSSWIAQMRVSYESKQVSLDQRFLNPLGFTITEYSVAKKR